MTTTGQAGESPCAGGEQSLEKEVKSFEKIELVGKLAAFSLPLTYVSGYLITTSYLGTYGLQSGTSEVLRAKYIYVGFEYLIFLVLVIAIYRTGMRIFEVLVLMKRGTDEDARNAFHQDRKAARDNLKVREEGEERRRQGFRKLRGDGVIGLLVFVFAFEILLINPDGLSGILPRQILFLLAVAIYQSTFFRELHPPFAWGLVVGKRFVDDTRWLLFLAQGFAGFSVLFQIGENLAKSRQPNGWPLLFRDLGGAFILIAFEIEIMGIFAAVARRGRLVRLDNGAKEDKPTTPPSGRNVLAILWAFFRFFWRRGIGATRGYFSPLHQTGWRHYGFLVIRGLALLVGFGLCIGNWRGGWLAHPGPVWTNVLFFLPLLLSMVVLGNLGLIVVMIDRRKLNLNFDPEPDYTETDIDGTWDPDKHREQIRREAKRLNTVERYARRTVMGSVLYVVSVLGFSYVVYPHIPVQKAGGNYVDQSKVTLTLVNEYSQVGCPQTLLPPLKKNESWIPLDEDSEWIYLAKNKDAGGPRAWSWPHVDHLCRPHVYAVSLKCIAGMTDSDAKEDDSGSGTEDECGMSFNSEGTRAAQARAQTPSGK